MEVNKQNLSDSNFLQINQEGESYDLEILLRRPSLRSNVPRKSSQIYPETIKTKETTCGIACLQGQWIQSFSNRTSFLVIYGALIFFYGSLTTYFYGSLTTLEKNFRLTSQNIGIIASTGEFVQVLICLVLFFCPVKNHRPRWIGAGIFLVFLSTLIWSSAQYVCENTTSLYKENQNSTNFPKGMTLTKNRDEAFLNLLIYMRSITMHEDVHDNLMQENCPIIYLSLAQILYGIGGSLFLVFGSAYVEDNIKDYQTPAILNLLLALKTIGLAFGYWLSSLCLKIFLNFNSSMAYDLHIKEEEPRWIGAWWFGNLMVAFFMVIPGFLISLYPTSMPKTVVRRIFNRVSRNEETIDSYGVSGSYKNILTSSLHYNNFTGIYNIFRFSVYFIFLTKYVEIQYGITASNANFTVGAISLLCSAFGTVLAGSLTSRHKPRILFLIAWNFIAGLLSIGCFIYYSFLGCLNNEIQIKSLILQFAALSLDAEVETSKISYLNSVCDEFGQTYLFFNMTGCSEIFQDNQAIICKVSNKNFINLNVLKTIQKGPCPVDCQPQLLKFVCIICIMSFIYGSGKISNFLIHIKGNDESVKYQLLNWGMFLNLLTFIPVPPLFGHFLDIACIFWDDNESQTGNCWLYDLENLRLYFNLTAIAVVIIGIISDTFVLFSMKNVELKYNVETGEKFLDEKQ